MTMILQYEHWFFDIEQYDHLKNQDTVIIYNYKKVKKSYERTELTLTIIDCQLPELNDEVTRLNVFHKKDKKSFNAELIFCPDGTIDYHGGLNNYLESINY